MDISSQLTIIRTHLQQHLTELKTCSCFPKSWNNITQPPTIDIKEIVVTCTPRRYCGFPGLNHVTTIIQCVLCLCRISRILLNACVLRSSTENEHYSITHQYSVLIPLIGFRIPPYFKQYLEETRSKAVCSCSRALTILNLDPTIHDSPINYCVDLLL